MENSSKVFAGATRATVPLDCLMELREDWRVARSTRKELHVLARLRVNLLVIGIDSVVQNIMDLLPALDEPIATWRPGERLVLPPVAEARTMILHEVGAMGHTDQQRLFKWSEQVAGRTRLVSTTDAPLFPRVQAGAFIESLYYRLNTVCVDVNG